MLALMRMRMRMLVLVLVLVLTLVLTLVLMLQLSWSNSLDKSYSKRPLALPCLPQLPGLRRPTQLRAARVGDT
jgi:hypothetical protein